MYASPFQRLDRQAGQFPGAQEDSSEHGAVEAAGVGVSKRRVVCGQKMQSIWKQIVCAVREAVFGFSSDGAGVQQMREVAIEGDLPEADDDADARQGLDFVGEMAGAVANLLWLGLVSGRGAANDRGDPGVAQFEAVVARGTCGLAGESQLVKNGIHEVAGPVTGEWAAGAVGSVGAGRETKDEDASPRVAEAGNRTRPVGLVQVSAALRFADAVAEVEQAGAAFAGDDGLANLLKERRRYLCGWERHCISS